jgi:putative inorganic carbon (HCO3(-)) transporter
VGKLLLLILLAGVAVVALAQPWIGVVVAYLFAILQPQAIWYWNFEGLRPVLWVLLPTLFGFFLALARKDFDFATLKNRRVLFMLILWFFYALSYFVGPYVDVRGPYRWTEPDWAFSTLNKILLIFFVGCLCINDERKLKALCGVILLAGGYLTYWANMQYLSGNVMGRLAGPVDIYGTGVYADENDFAMVFVVAQAFFWYMGFATRRILLRWGLWLVIPFAWHAIFLTASRGGLVGIGVTILLMALRSKNRMLGLLIIPAFAIAYVWQAGDLMRSRAQTIDEYRTETAAATRLEAWEAAASMIVTHPITGVGLASFGPAFPDHSTNKPRVAHNTFFQIAAESGLIAGAMYALLVITSLVALWKNGERLRDSDSGTSTVYLINEATLVGFTGFAVCSMFLSLPLSEIFYWLCLVTNAVLFVSSRAATAPAQTAASARQRFPRPFPGRRAGVAAQAQGRFRPGGPEGSGQNEHHGR